eukprot:scaffold4658_cov31-Cyclotella_meneghiniana.AAC.1
MKWRGVEFGDSVRVQRIQQINLRKNIISALTVMLRGGKYLTRLQQRHNSLPENYPEGVRVRAGKYGADVMKYAVFGGSGVDARPIA